MPVKSIRVATIAYSAVFVSARIAATSRSSVENPGSSRRARTSSSNATLIRSAGLSFVVTALRIASSAITRALPASYFTPTNAQTSPRRHFAVRSASCSAITSPDSPSKPHTWSTTTAGTSSSFGKHPSR